MERLITILGRHRRLVAVAAGALLLVPLFVPIPATARHSPLMGEFGDRLHVLIFAGLAALLAVWGPTKGHIVRAALVAAAIGAASEVAQGYVGRSPALGDVLLDCIGIGFLVAGVAWWRRRSQAAVVAAIVLVALLGYTMRNVPSILRAAYAMRRSVPLMADFDAPVQLAVWHAAGEATLTWADVGGAHGGVLRVSTPATSNWSGAMITRMPADWSHYTAMALDVRLVGDTPDSLRMSLRLDDHETRRDKDWALRTVVATHDWRTVTLPLSGLATYRDGRAVLTRDVFALGIIRGVPRVGATYEVDNLRLLGDAAVR